MAFDVLRAFELETLTVAQTRLPLAPQDDEDEWLDVFSRRSRKQPPLQGWQDPSISPRDLFDVGALPQIFKLTEKGDDRSLLLAAHAIRKILSAESNPPVQAVIDFGFLPHLKLWLQRSDLHHLQFEAAWAVTNIASSTSQHTSQIATHGFIPLLITLLSSPNENVREQAVWALGNIAGDSIQLRNIVLESGALPFCIECIMTSTSTSMVRNSAWAISNFCRGKPSPNYEFVVCSVPVLAKVMQTDDSEVLVDCCWALSRLSDGAHDRVQAVIDCGVCPRLLQLLSRQTSIQLPAIRTLGNIAAGSEAQTRHLLNCGVLSGILLCLAAPKAGVCKEALWTLSNICTGSARHVMAVQSAGIFPAVVPLLAADRMEVRKEAMWVVASALASKGSQLVGDFLALGVVPALCDLLKASDEVMLKLALKCLKRLMRSDTSRADDAGNAVVKAFEGCGGLELIEALQQHPSQVIYQKVVSILEEFFETKD